MIQNSHPISNLISVIKSCTQKSQLLQIHAQLICRCLTQEPTISFPFLSRLALSPIQDIIYSRQFFSEIANPSVFQYNTMIRAYSMSDSPINGFYLYQEMRKKVYLLIHYLCRLLLSVLLELVL